MKKLIITLSTLFIGICVNQAAAQQFSFLKQTVNGCTNDAGAATFNDCGNNYTELISYFVNHSEEPIAKYEWQILTEGSEIPNGWYLYAFCDDATCLIVPDPTGGGFHKGEPVECNMEIAAKDTGSLKPWICNGGNDGTAIIKVKISTDKHTDTAVFVLEKPCGNTSVFDLNNDTRVTVFPNPASSMLKVFVDNSLQASQLMVVSMDGRIVAQHATTSSQLNVIEVSNLSTGIYQVNVIDQKGNVIATRKFTKQ